ncbi:PilN domain-containing protein [Acidobacteriota bacterium]
MIRINLLKPEKKSIRETPATPAPEFEEKKGQPKAGLIFLLLIIVVAVLFFYQQRSMSMEQGLLRTAQEEKQKLQGVLEKLEKLEAQKALYERKIGLIKRLKARQGIAVTIMDELSKHLPQWVWLFETQYENEIIQIKGNALSNNLIADYIFNLESSDHFTEVDLISSTQKTTQNNQYLEFALRVRYVLPFDLVIPTEQVPQRKTK